MTPFRKGTLYLLIASVLFGFNGFFSKYSYSYGMNPIMLVAVRSAFGVLLLLLVLLFKREKIVPALRRGQWVTVIIVSLLYAATQTLFLASFVYMDSGLCVSVQFCFPALILIMGALFFHDRVVPSDVFCFFLCFAGIVLLILPGHVSLTGILLAFLSGLCFAWYSLVLEKCRVFSYIGKLSLSLVINAITLIVILPVAAATGNLTLSLPCQAYLYGFILALNSSVVAAILYQTAVSLINAKYASLLITVELVVAIAVGIVAFHETVLPLTITGSVCILLSAVFLVLFKENFHFTKHHLRH
ncbi:MAG: DMT family transporter [Clostridia bacterium]|nr:DMT family transporter [Clostridia bacterium]MBR0444607.1 DMT family transporter [Clostridia bacterium]